LIGPTKRSIPEFPSIVMRLSGRFPKDGSPAAETAREMRPAYFSGLEYHDELSPHHARTKRRSKPSGHRRERPLTYRLIPKPLRHTMIPRNQPAFNLFSPEFSAPSSVLFPCDIERRGFPGTHRPAPPYPANVSQTAGLAAVRGLRGSSVSRDALPQDPPLDRGSAPCRFRRCSPPSCLLPQTDSSASTARSFSRCRTTEPIHPLRRTERRSRRS